MRIALQKFSERCRSAMAISSSRHLIRHWLLNDRPIQSVLMLLRPFEDCNCGRNLKSTHPKLMFNWHFQISYGWRIRGAGSRHRSADRPRGDEDLYCRCWSVRRDFGRREPSKTQSEARGLRRRIISAVRLGEPILRSWKVPSLRGAGDSREPEVDSSEIPMYA